MLSKTEGQLKFSTQGKADSQLVGHSKWFIVKGLLIRAISHKGHREGMILTRTAVTITFSCTDFALNWIKDKLYIQATLKEIHPQGLHCAILCESSRVLTFTSSVGDKFQEISLHSKDTKKQPITRVVPKVMSNFFCMRIGNSRRRRVRW